MIKNLLRFQLCLLITLLTAFLPVFASKDKVKIAPLPNWVQVVKPNTETSIKEEEISYGYAVLQRQSVYHVEKQYFTYTQISKILSNTGVQYGSEIEVSYDPSYEQLVFHSVNVHREGVSKSHLSPAKFKVMQKESSKESYLYDGSLTALLILDDIREGDVIDYSFSIIGRNPAYQGKFFNTFYLSHEEPLDKVLYKVIIPSTRKLYIEALNTTYKPEVYVVDNQTIYEWELESVPATKADPEIPAWYNPYPTIRVSEFASWEEVKQVGLQIFAVSAERCKNVDTYAKEIQEKYSLPSERLEAALKFVQNKVRYTGLEAGISAYKPHAPEQVYNQRFGDCKDKSLLLSYILNKMGIQAYPALVNTSYRKELKAILPSMGAFNHCIVKVEMEGKSYWYDPTISLQEGKFDNIYVPDYGMALTIKPGESALETIPVFKNSKTHISEVFKMDSIGGAVRLSVTSVYVGGDADQGRNYFANKSLKYIEDQNINYYAYSYPNITPYKPLRIKDNTEQNIFTVEVEYLIENFWKAEDSTSSVLKCENFPYVIRDRILVPKNSKRTMPLAQEYPQHVEHTVSYHMPKPFHIKGSEDTIVTAGSIYRHKVSYEDNVITKTLSFETTTDHIPVEATAEYIQKHKSINNQLGLGIPYYGNKVLAESSLYGINWLFVLICFLTGIGVFIAALKAYQYDPDPQLNVGSGREIGGWLTILKIGLLLDPLLVLWRIINSHYFDKQNWNYLTDAHSGGYNLTLAGMIVAKQCYYIIQLGISVLILFLFFNRRTSFPKVLATGYIFALLFLLSDYMILESMNELSASEVKSSLANICRIAILGCIWLSYLHRSRRAQTTFVVRLPVMEKENVKA